MLDHKFLFLLCGVFVLATAGCGKKASVAAPDAPLIVGMELAYRPFEMTDAQNKATGVSVDLAKALGESLGRPVQIENIPFDGLITALRTGKIDLVISSMTATADRARTIDFSDPYVKTGLALLVGKNSPVQKFDDLTAPGRKLAVKQGTTAHLVASQRLPAANLLVFDQEEACVLEVIQGKADAFAYDQMAVFRHWNKNRDNTRALLEPFTSEEWAIGLKKGNDALRSQVNAFLAGFAAKGGFEKLAEQYLPDEQKAFKEMNIPFIFVR